jgi:hypothetical protein
MIPRSAQDDNLGARWRYAGRSFRDEEQLNCIVTDEEGTKYGYRWEYIC